MNYTLIVRKRGTNQEVFQREETMENISTWKLYIHIR